MHFVSLAESEPNSDFESFPPQQFWGGINCDAGDLADVVTVGSYCIQSYFEINGVQDMRRKDMQQLGKFHTVSK